LEEGGNSGESFFDTFTEGFDYSDSSGSVIGVIGVSVSSSGTPVLEVFNGICKVSVVIGESLEGFIELNNNGFGGGDEVVKSGNLVLEGSSLFI
jgi:hypothetical protein